MNYPGADVMARKRKKTPAGTLNRESRIARARNWLPAYEGTRAVRAYRRKFHVDTVCAVRELREIGYEFKPGYVDSLLKAEAARVERLKAEKEEKRLTERHDDWQDGRFCFIAGYTSGGAPYGVTWEEMGLEPFEREIDDEEEIVCRRYYDFLSKREKDAVDSTLREGFSNYVSAFRRLPNKGKRRRLIEQVFESNPWGSLQYDGGFDSAYLKIVRKRENRLIRDGVLPRRFTPTEVRKYFERSVMLESGRITFRKITEDDFDSLAAMLRAPEVIAERGHTFSDEDIHKWIDDQVLRYRKHIVGCFAAILKDTGELIGQMGLTWSDFGELRAPEIVYMPGRGYWGIGYATEGADALTRYAFEETGVNKAYASIRPENKRAISIAERIGMTAEGSFVKRGGKETGHAIYSKGRR
jgi:RimJ/RimL family protein N-acetyltransferase